MKRNDIISVVFIASISALIAWFTANTFIGEPKQKPVKVETAQAIEITVEAPDKRVFNSRGINPTVDRSIGKSSNSLSFESIGE